MIELDKTGFALARPLVSGRARLEFEVPEAKGSHTAPTMATLVKQQKPLPEVWPSVENNTAEATCNFIHISVAGEL